GPMTEPTAHSPLFQPIRVGRMDLRNRIMLPPHGQLTGDLFGSERQARATIAYWRRRAESGAAWICGLNGFVGNTVIPGFEPTGLGATVRGVFRLPHFRERAARYAEAVRSAGAYASAQLIMQGACRTRRRAGWPTTPTARSRTCWTPPRSPGSSRSTRSPPQRPGPPDSTEW